MKRLRLKSLIFAGLAGCLLCFPACAKGSLTEISKPYLGEYECESATLGEQDFLAEFTYLRLELKSNGEFVLRYQTKQGGQGQETGRYEYDDGAQSIRFVANGQYQLDRNFSMERGEICLTFPIGKQMLSIRFAQK